jgi:transcriptional regulator with XRE-family HTH domain
MPIPAQGRRLRTAKEHGPDPIDLHVGRQLRLARELAGLTQAEIGIKLGMSFQVVQKYEQGEIRVSASRLLRLAQALDRPVSYLFEGLEYSDPSGAVTGRREAELVRAFRRIEDAAVQQQFLLLIRSMGDPEADAEN